MNKQFKIKVFNFCIEKLIKSNIFFINSKKLSKCSFEEVLNEYNFVFGSNGVNDCSKYLSSFKKTKEPTKNGFIYFAVNEDLSFCKIGFSENPSKRISEIQTGCPFKLYISHFL